MKEIVTVSFAPDVKRFIETKAAESGISKSNYVERCVLKEFLREEMLHDNQTMQDLRKDVSNLFR